MQSTLRTSGTASKQDMSIRQLLRDEEGFLRRAGAREFTQAVLYFRSMASKATTPQARDFYMDRANQFSLRAVQSGGFGGAPRRMVMNG